MPQGGKLDSVLRGCAEAAEKEAGGAGLLPGEQGRLEQGPEELQIAKYPGVGVLWG